MAIGLKRLGYVVRRVASLSTGSVSVLPNETSARKTRQSSAAGVVSLGAEGVAGVLGALGTWVGELGPETGVDGAGGALSAGVELPPLTVATGAAVEVSAVARGAAAE